MVPICSGELFKHTYNKNPHIRNRFFTFSLLFLNSHLSFQYGNQKIISKQRKHTSSRFNIMSRPTKCTFGFVFVLTFGLPYYCFLEKMQSVVSYNLVSETMQAFAVSKLFHSICETHDIIIPCKHHCLTM